MKLLTEAIEDLTFAIIEVVIPKKDAEFQTYIQIHGTDQSILRSGQSSILGADNACDMCDGSGMIKIGDAIDKRIAKPYAKRSDFEGWEPERFERWNAAQVNWLTNAKARLEHTGEINKEITCPVCFSWRWVGIPQYAGMSRTELSKKEKKGKVRKPLPWEIFMDWIWDSLTEAGIEPEQQDGFEERPEGMVKDKYGVLLSGGELGHYMSKYVVLNVASLGATRKRAHRALVNILNKHADKLPFKIQSWPNEKQEEKLEFAISRAADSASAPTMNKLKNIEKDLDENRAIYISGQVEDFRFGEDIGLEAYGPIRGIDIIKLIEKLGGAEKRYKPSAEMPLGIGGEWGEAIGAIKGFSAAERSKRSLKAGETIVQSPAFKAKRKEWDKYKFEQDVSVEFPGPKFKHWDTSIQNIADEIGKTPAEVEAAIVKYLTTVKGYKAPFNFNRLSHEDAVDVLHAINAIKSEDLLHMTESVSLDSIVEDSKPFKLVDMGCLRANILICELRKVDRQLEGMSGPLLCEDHNYNRLMNRKKRLTESLEKITENILDEGWTNPFAKKLSQGKIKMEVPDGGLFDVEGRGDDPPTWTPGAKIVDGKLVIDYQSGPNQQSAAALGISYIKKLGDKIADIPFAYLLDKFGDRIPERQKEIASLYFNSVPHDADGKPIKLQRPHEEQPVGGGRKFRKFTEQEKLDPSYYSLDKVARASGISKVRVRQIVNYVRLKLIGYYAAQEEGVEVRD